MTPDVPATLAHVAADGRRIFDLAEANPDADVPACPGWNLTDLAIHTSGVHRRVAHWVANRVSQMESCPDGEPADPTNPFSWCREGLGLLLVTLKAADPHASVWSWTDRRNAGFYQRRMMHENAIHRWDAESAVGTPGPIDADVATDGVDEVLAVGMRFQSSGSPIEYPDGSVLLARTDGTDRWLVRSLDGTLQVARNGDAGGSADATVTGHAEDLLLYLWGRSSAAVIG
ncbi:MAG: maleylpyruvate isomerase family mycothiol-dependent enzyme, partial [Acidimicrobiales bacterium]